MAVVPPPLPMLCVASGFDDVSHLPPSPFETMGIRMSHFGYGRHLVGTRRHGGMCCSLVLLFLPSPSSPLLSWLLPSLMLAFSLWVVVVGCGCCFLVLLFLPSPSSPLLSWFLSPLMLALWLSVVVVVLGAVVNRRGRCCSWGCCEPSLSLLVATVIADAAVVGCCGLMLLLGINPYDSWSVVPVMIVAACGVVGGTMLPPTLPLLLFVLLEHPPPQTMPPTPGDDGERRKQGDPRRSAVSAVSRGCGCGVCIFGMRSRSIVGNIRGNRQRLNAVFKNEARRGESQSMV